MAGWQKRTGFAIMVAVIAVILMPSTIENTVISDAPKAEVEQLRQLLGDRQASAARGPRSIKLPERSYRLLMRIIDDLAEGKAVSITTAAQEMTTQQAANFLGVSRQFLVRLLDDGQIPFHRAGTHRRVYFQDMISYRNVRDRRRHVAIVEMAKDAVQDGIYDEF
jgi:excisionase family DNA binding protein